MPAIGGATELVAAVLRRAPGSPRRERASSARPMTSAAGRLTCAVRRPAHRAQASAVGMTMRISPIPAMTLNRTSGALRDPNASMPASSTRTRPTPVPTSHSQLDCQRADQRDVISGALGGGVPVRPAAFRPASSPPACSRSAALTSERERREAGECGCAGHRRAGRCGSRLNLRVGLGGNGAVHGRRSWRDGRGQIAGRE